MTDSGFKMHIIVNGSKNIFLSNVLRNKLINILSDNISKTLRILISILCKNISERRIIYILCDSELFRVAIDKACNINHHIRKNLDIALLTLNKYIRDTCVLNLSSKCAVNLSTCSCDHLACILIYYILCKNMTINSVLEVKLLIKFITSNLSKIISSCIKEHSGDKALCTFYAERFTGTNLLI